jgi:hypothetical protein
MLIVLPLLVCLIGLVVYAISVNPKAQVIAEDCFWVGLLAFLLRFAGDFAITR